LLKERTTSAYGKQSSEARKAECAYFRVLLERLQK